MAQNGLWGPFTLSDQVIDEEVTHSGAGVYLLEQSADLVNFRVVYVGRSDTNVNQLHVHVGSYKRFRYEYCSSVEAAYEKECTFYHDFEPHDNPVHPQRPSGTDWKCPRCRLA
jgi:hypothetical protein